MEFHNTRIYEVMDSLQRIDTLHAERNPNNVKIQRLEGKLLSSKKYRMEQRFFQIASGDQIHQKLRQRVHGKQQQKERAPCNPIVNPQKLFKT